MESCGSNKYVSKQLIYFCYVHHALKNQKNSVTLLIEIINHIPLNTEIGTD